MFYVEIQKYCLYKKVYAEPSICFLPQKSPGNIFTPHYHHNFSIQNISIKYFDKKLNSSRIMLILWLEVKRFFASFSLNVNETFRNYYTHNAIVIINF